MKLRNLTIMFATILVVCATAFSGCGVVPAAWVELKMDSGYVQYTSYMYPTSHNHINYFASEEDASDDSKIIFSITFFPRILGPEVTEIDGVKTRRTVVDVSKYVDATIYIYKNHPAYDASKEIYLNGQKVTPTTKNEYDNLTALNFEDFPLIRGNPGGQFNNKINIIEYK